VKLRKRFMQKKLGEGGEVREGDRRYEKGGGGI